MNKRDYIEFIDSWMSRKENCWRSFTYWNALYDWVKESRFDLEDLWIRNDLEFYIQEESNADIEWVYWLSDNAIIEIVDISVLDEYGRKVQYDIDEEDKQEIFDALDDYDSFETRQQYEDIVADLVDKNWNTNLNRRTVADEYEEDNFLTIKEEENV